MAKKIAIIQTGQPIASVLKKYGDFDAWFIKHMQINKAMTQTYRVYESLKFPIIDNIAGIIITGSPAMVTDSLDWSEKTISWLKQFLTLNIPVLGVCYGHQQLAKLLGGTVDWNPSGRQIGQVQLQLTEAALSDKLMKSVINPSSNKVNFLATHQQSVTSLPDDVTLLASTKLDPFHCFRYKDHIWGLQFHPEFNADITKDYVHARALDITAEGLNPLQILEKIEENNNGLLLLNRFKNICFGKL